MPKKLTNETSFRIAFFLSRKQNDTGRRSRAICGDAGLLMLDVFRLQVSYGKDSCAEYTWNCFDNFSVKNELNTISSTKVDILTDNGQMIQYLMSRLQILGKKINCFIQSVVAEHRTDR
jgi:hypothetical protein